jgi:hypothetical protein
MLSLKTILETIMTDLSDTMPTLLIALGLTDYAEYILGMPRDDLKSTMSVMFDPDIPLDNTMSRLPILFFAQLVSIDYEIALQYADEIIKFIKAFDSQKIKCTLLDSTNMNIIPLERERTTLIYITANFTEPLDSCDN